MHVHAHESCLSQSFQQVKTQTGSNTGISPHFIASLTKSYSHCLKADVQTLTRTIFNYSLSAFVPCFCVVFYHKLYPLTPITRLILFLPACQPSCATCENDFECTACGGSFLLSGRQCVTTCERGLFQDHTRCLSKSTAVYISFTFIVLTFCDTVYICCTFMMLSYQC